MGREMFVNEETGEVLTPAEYAAAVRAVEKAIYRLDRTIDDLRSSLKAAKEDRDKAISALRGYARDSRYKTQRPKVVKLRKSDAQTSAPPR